MLEGRGISQFREHGCRPQVGKKIALFTQAQKRFFGTLVARQRIVFRPANCAEQHRIGILRKLERRRRQGLARGIISDTTHQRAFGFDFHAVAAQHLKHLDSFGHDFGAYTISSE